jgi:hypothetical protein
MHGSVGRRLRLQLAALHGHPHRSISLSSTTAGPSDSAAAAAAAAGAAGELQAVTQMETRGAGVLPNRYYSIQECLRMPGVRYTAVPECPAPISEPLKQILWVKKIPAARVPHPADPAVGLAFLSDAAGCELLQQTTAQTSWPVLWCDDERPRTAWLEQLELAERLVSQSHVTLSHAADVSHADLRLLALLTLTFRSYSRAVGARPRY